MSKGVPIRRNLWLTLGLLATSLSSILEHLISVGSAANFPRGLLDGLSVVFFGTAIFALASQWRHKPACTPLRLGGQRCQAHKIPRVLQLYSRASDERPVKGG